MRKARHCAALLFCVLGVVLVGQGRVYYVSLKGDDARSCDVAQDEARPRATVAAGVACLSAGDTLYIRGGTYQARGWEHSIDSQNATVRSGTNLDGGGAITISGYPGETVTIMPPAGVSVVRLSAGDAPTSSNLIIKDLTMDGSRGLNEPGITEAIFTNNAAHIRIQNTVIQKWRIFAVHPVSPFFEFIGNYVRDIGVAGATNVEGHALYVTGNDGLYEGNFVVRAQGYGFHFYNTRANDPNHTAPSRNVIKDNVIIQTGLNGNGPGIVITWGEKNVVTNNTIDRSSSGIWVYTDAKDTLVEGNKISNVALEGIALQFYRPGTVVRNNTITPWNNRAVMDYGTAVPGSAPVISANSSSTAPQPQPQPKLEAPRVLRMIP